MSALSLDAPAEHQPTKVVYRFRELVLILLAVAASVVAYVLVGLGTEGDIPGNVYSYGGVLLGLGLLAHVVVQWRARYADQMLLPIAVLLNGIGLAMIFRIDQAKDTSVADQQLIWMGLGTVLAILVVIFLKDHRILRRYTYVAGLAAFFFLLLPLLPFIGVELNGARIWIRVAGMSFQPAELAKIALAVFFAGYFVTFRDSIVLAGPKFLGIQWPRPRDLGPIVIVWIASVGILVFQRDLGTSLLIFGLFVAVLYVATAKKTWILLGAVFFTGGAVVASRIFSHVQQRVDGWLGALDPEVYGREFGGSYQLVQGLFGLSNGGLMGTGLGKGRPDIVPFANSDFIIASLGEELGLVGLFAILMLFVLLMERGMKTALLVRDGFGKLLAAGLSFVIALQCFIVVGGVTRLIPLTGLTTPFMAAGGSSLIANWIIIGILLRISDNARRPQEEFHTGVLGTLASSDEDISPRKAAKARAAAAAAEAPAGEQQWDHSGSGQVFSGEVPQDWSGQVPASEALTQAGVGQQQPGPGEALTQAGDGGWPQHDSGQYGSGPQDSGQYGSAPQDFGQYGSGPRDHGQQGPHPDDPQSGPYGSQGGPRP